MFIIDIQPLREFCAHARKRKKISLAAIGAYAGLSSQSVGNFERGDTPGSIALLTSYLKLCFEVEITDLMQFLQEKEV